MSSSTKPAVDPQAVITQALQHLRSGAVQAADDLLSQAAGQPTQAEAAAAAAAAPKPKRKANLILGDILKTTSALLGNSPAIAALVDEILPVIEEL